MRISDWSSVVCSSDLFRRRFALAKGGVFDPSEPRWRDALGVADRLPHDMFAPFLQIARAAMEGEPCPDDEILGRAYGSRSPGRIRRLVEYMEKQGRKHGAKGRSV